MIRESSWLGSWHGPGPVRGGGDSQAADSPRDWLPGATRVLIANSRTETRTIRLFQERVTPDERRGRAPEAR